ncbi:MAG: 3-phosphoshikimate 1-carboxyvinyltransferase [Acidimicrobiales bacterium]
MTGSAPPDWLSRSALELVPTGPVQGTLEAPSSKSLTNRALVIAALAKGRSVLSRLLRSDDTAVMISGLVGLGVGIEDIGGDTEVTGTAGRPVASGRTLNAGLSGTTLRFLAALALITEGTVVLDGEEPLRRRPIGQLLEVLGAAGAEVLSENGRPPLRISGSGLLGGRLHVDASASSQFATALLMVAPYADDDLIVEVEGLRELGYVRLTVATMTRWGARVDEEAPGTFKVSARYPYLSRAESIEHDASAAAHLYALAVATRGSITVANAFETAQPDGGLLEVLAAMGAMFSRGPGGTTVERRGELTGIDVDLAAMPDQVPTIAVLAALARGETVIRGVEIVRGHESDRITAVATELGRLGAQVEEAPDGLVVHGGAPLHGGRIDTHRDHRIAMAFTAIGAVVPGVELSDPGCVAKTYPRFFDDVARLGVGIG